MRPAAWFVSILKGCAILGLGFCWSCSNGSGPGNTGPNPNSPPGSVIITGPSTAVIAHASVYTLSAVDPEADAITFSTTTAGAIINGSTLAFIPAMVAPESAPAIISVVATDSKGAASTPRTTAVIVTANVAPRFNSTPPGSGIVGLALSYTPSTETDPEGDAITITKTAGPGTYAGGVLAYTPVLEDVTANPTFTFSADDGHGGMTLQTFTIIVTANLGPAPTITQFTPTSGPVDTSVILTGTNFSSASAVAFNGANASFTVNSATQITALVPAAATSGPIAVTTPGGTANSATAFTVQGITPTLAAFPGAEGFGGSVTGGRGGRVIYVTTLASDPNGTTPGSFQWACNQEGPRYILFKVSGLIDGGIQLTRGDVTIAGHTSPGGIIVRQFHTTEDPYCDGDPGCLGNPATHRAENWILRHLRMRPANGGYDDALRILSTRRGIVDHCSMANAEDECVQVSQCNDITIQDSILAETLGGHANLGGLLLNYSAPSVGLQLDRITLVRNVWNRLMGRMPEMSRESPQAGASVLNLELSNNLLWDPGFYIDVNQTTISGSDAGQPIYYALNWIGNYAHARPDFPFGMMSFPVNSPSGATATFFSDNQMNLYPARRDYQLLYCCNDYPATVANPGQLPYPDPSQPPAFAVNARHAFPSPTYLPSSQVRTHIHQNAGAFPRDPMDRRLMQPLQSGVFDPAPRDQNPYNDAFLFDWTIPPAPPVDTDGDGMPDAWEQSNGLNPNDPSDGQATNLSLPKLGVAGYPNLEVYLHELHLQRLATLPPTRPTAGRRAP